MNLTTWLQDHPLISLNALEKQCGIPQSTLSKAIKGRMKLPEKHWPALVEALKKYGLKVK